MSRTTKRTTIHLDANDRAAIAEIRRRYGVASASDAIRLAVRLLAQSTTVVDLRSVGTPGAVESEGRP